MQKFVAIRQMVAADVIQPSLLLLPNLKHVPGDRIASLKVSWLLPEILQQMFVADISNSNADLSYENLKLFTSTDLPG
jgi:hypothetical protein